MKTNDHHITEMQSNKQHNYLFREQMRKRKKTEEKERPTDRHQEKKKERKRETVKDEDFILIYKDSQQMACIAYQIQI